MAYGRAGVTTAGLVAAATGFGVAATTTAAAGMTGAGAAVAGVSAATDAATMGFDAPAACATVCVCCAAAADAPGDRCVAAAVDTAVKADGFKTGAATERDAAGAGAGADGRDAAILAAYA